MKNEGLMKKGKIIVISAPSGTGKSTVIKELMKNQNLRLGFSVSATSRPPRGMEKDGVEYYFLSPEEFRRKVKAGEFVEWEEVYAGTCYGTLRSEIDRVTSEGKNLIMDIDVNGAMQVKKLYGNEALALFIIPPSIEELENRLRGRGTDTDDVIARRLERASYEMQQAERFDRRVVNDSVSRAVAEITDIVECFIDNEKAL